MGRPVALGPLRRLPEYLTIWVPLLVSAGHLVSFALWTIWVSFTPSTLVPVAGWVGTRNYTAVMATRNWQIAFDNLLVFGCGFVLLSLTTGLLLAILLDQRIRGENVLRSIFLYPMAVSFVVTGTVWSWLLNPGLGIQKLVNGFGYFVSVRLADRPRHGDLDHRDCRGLAVIGLCHGTVSGRSAFGGCGPAEGRADRRRRSGAYVPARGSTDAMADHGDRRGHSVAICHHDI